jgi:hypothetical protein
MVMGRSERVEVMAAWERMKKHHPATVHTMPSRMVGGKDENGARFIDLLLLVYAGYVLDA